ncbi:DUF397 domain-containing protein [Streptomyces sp. NBC_01306]|uniref:DUF397 domain-containing protein n=1 Tax=Streptomyces sp. NBC_01306 TaxID=2903819 RepID=UPI00225AEF99|nr:DUF397 domain-containing protein [Streptomyces sp. NBC_01306]MCX4724926.1 DUF397 domain-containing protein [Streptomyces sp. NBC_01306]
MSKFAHVAEPNWRSSTYSQSNGGECVQVAAGTPGFVPVRDSKNPTGPALAFPASAFSSFIEAVQQDTIGRS